MMNQFTKIVSIGKKTLFTLISGDTLEGEVTDFGIDYVILKTNKGIAGIHYKMIGAWEIFLDISTVQSEENDKVTSLELEQEIVPNDNDIEYVQMEDFKSTKDNEEEKEDYNFLKTEIGNLLEDFPTKVENAKLTLNEPNLSFPLSSIDSENPSEEKKLWDKINSQYQNCIKNRTYSQISTFTFELLKFAEKYPDIGAFHYNAGCFKIRVEDFERSLSYFEEAFSREPSPEYLYNAAYASLRISNSEKAHINLAVYFNMVDPMDDPDAWYIFCGLTGKEHNISIFRDVLLSSMRDKTGNKKERGLNQIDENYTINNTLFLLRSCLYVLQNNLKYKEAEPLISFTRELETRKQIPTVEKLFSLLESSLPDSSGEDFARYQKLIELLKAYKETNLDRKLNEEIDHKKIIDTSIIQSDKVCEINTHIDFSIYLDENIGKDECSEKLYNLIPRIHGYIFKYISPKGFGFIRDEKGESYFFHLSSIIDNSISSTEMNNVYWGTEIHVIFHPTKNDEGKMAVQISSYEVLNEMKKLAERYAEGGEYNKAIELSEYILSIDPDYPIPNSSLKDWQAKLEKVIEKEQALNDHIEAEPNSRESWDSKASFLIENERYNEALPVLDKVIEFTPDVVNSLPSGRQLASFDQIYGSNPEYIQALRKKSLVFYLLGRNGEALEIVGEALELDPEDLDSLALRASCLMRLDRSKEAQEIIDHLLEKRADSFEFLFLKGKSLLKFHNYEKGLQYLEKALQKSSKNPDILLKYGYALSKLGKFDAAIKAYDKVINLQPENIRALSNKGFILIMKGEYEKALKLYNGLIQLNPLNPSLWSKKGAILTKMNRSEDALRAIDRALETAPESAEALFTKGYMYSKIGREEEALKYFDQVLELSPLDQKALAKRAFVLSKLGKHSDAFSSIEEALDINRYSSRTWYYKGFIHYNLGEYDEALFAFNKSAELNPADNRIERMIQTTLAKLDMYDGRIETSVGEPLADEELFDKEIQEEYDATFQD